MRFYLLRSRNQRSTIKSGIDTLKAIDYIVNSITKVVGKGLVWVPWRSQLCAVAETLFFTGRPGSSPSSKSRLVYELRWCSRQSRLPGRPNNQRFTCSSFSQLGGALTMLGRSLACATRKRSKTLFPHSRISPHRRFVEVARQPTQLDPLHHFWA